MRYLIFAFFLIPFQAMALGPIPNGTYKGSQQCWDPYGTEIQNEVLEITVTDSTMSWPGVQKQFVSTWGEFFKMLHYSADDADKVLTGLGHGYFTATGLHFNAMIDIGPFVAEGQDTFTYADGLLSLVGTAGSFTCNGTFSLQEKNDGK